jgi:hypothetical protein
MAGGAAMATHTTAIRYYDGDMVLLYHPGDDSWYLCPTDRPRTGRGESEYRLMIIAIMLKLGVLAV